MTSGKASWLTHCGVRCVAQALLSMRFYTNSPQACSSPFTLAIDVLAFVQKACQWYWCQEQYTQIRIS